MAARYELPRALSWLALSLLLISASGCGLISSQIVDGQDNQLARRGLYQHGPDGLVEGVDGEPVSPPPVYQPPSELTPISLPMYRVEPPDVLLIEAVRMAPKAPYLIKTLDILLVNVAGTLPDQPIQGTFQVEPSGQINLGPSYGTVEAVGKTIHELTGDVEKQLRRVLNAPEVSISLFQTSGQQQIAGEHLVGPDGTVNLGIYGSVYVAGMTLDEVREAVETHLSRYLDKPEVSVDVFAYNSKVYYIITEGAGFGDNVVRVPVTGNETVLDAIAQIGGMQQISSKTMWIARPAPGGVGCDQILPIDWVAVTKGGATGTNYQMLPGDRLFISQDRLVAFDRMIAKMTAPGERLFGFLLLGTQTIQTINRSPLGLLTR